MKVILFLWLKSDNSTPLAFNFWRQIKRKKTTCRLKAFHFLTTWRQNKKKRTCRPKNQLSQKLLAKFNISAKGKTVRKMQTVRLCYTAMKMDVIGFWYYSGESKVSCSLYGLLPLYQRHCDILNLMAKLREIVSAQASSFSLFYRDGLNGHLMESRITPTSCSVHFFINGLTCLDLYTRNPSCL